MKKKNVINLIFMGFIFYSLFSRARRASARNFEIIDPEDHNTIYLLHGKWEKNLFNLDYRFPMNMAQAFSFSLVSVSKKFLV